MYPFCFWMLFVQFLRKHIIFAIPSLPQSLFWRIFIRGHSRQYKTRKSACVNTRGIPPAVYQVLHPLSYPGGAYPIPGQGEYPIPGWGVSHPWIGGTSILGYPPLGPGRGTPPGVDTHTPVKTVPYRRITYAVDNRSGRMKLFLVCQQSGDKTEVIHEHPQRGPCGG